MPISFKSMQDVQGENSKIVNSKLSYRIYGFCFYVHNKLGRYRNEQQYADLLENTLKEKDIKYEREKSLPVSFEGEKERRNIPDFIIEDEIVVDLKAKIIISKDDYFQMKRYLVSSKKRLGLIVNFRQKYLKPKRILNGELLSKN